VIRVAPLFSCLCCPIVLLYALSSVLCGPLRFPHRNDVRFVLISSWSYESSWLIYIICACLRLVVSKAYCVACLLCFSSSCLSCVAIFSGLSFFYCPIRYSLTFNCNLTIAWSSVTCLFLEHPVRGVCIRIIPLSLL
jgi:hypothetical protein